jgi:hypothetical protein
MAGQVWALPDSPGPEVRQLAGASGTVWTRDHHGPLWHRADWPQPGGSVTFGELLLSEGPLREP